MAKNKRKLNEYLSSTNIVIGLLVFFLILIITVITGKYLLKNNEYAPITEDQIMIQKGGNIIIVNKNGLIEYRSGDEVFYKHWDSTKISFFFERMDLLARDYIDKRLIGECSTCTDDGCYSVTLYVDGKLVTICINEDIGIDEIFAGFEEDELDFGNLDEYFNDDEGDDDIMNSPTPTVTYQFLASPTPTNIFDDGSDSNYPPLEVGCEAWSQDIVNRAVISNTLCTVVED